MDFNDPPYEPEGPEDPVRPTWLLADPEPDGDIAVTPLDEPVASMAQEPPPPAMSAPARPSTRRAALTGALTGALVAAVVSGGIAMLTDDDVAPRAAPVAISNGESLDVRAVLRAVEGAVVAINVQQAQGGLLARGAGSGMVIDADGLILTNNHVISGAVSISVTLADGREEPADLVGSIRSNDVALIKVRNVHDLDVVQFGSSSDLRVGDPVVAIGNALGLGGTPSVTAGIVSALGRELGAEGGIELEDLIQTDAAIYPGNSGGPLANAEGEIIGVNTAIARGPEGVGSENLGFALPIDQLKPLIDELKDGGGEVRGGAFLGVRSIDVDDVQPVILERLGVKTDYGAFIAEVVPSSAADDAGIEAGDVIVEIEGGKVSSAADVGERIADLDPGDEIDVVVEREGDRKTLTVTLGSRGVEQ